MRQREKLTKELSQALEKDIFKLLAQAELLLELEPELGIQLLCRADGLYYWGGYDFEVECRINDVCFSYMREHPSI